jgi:hypothetical protein
MFPYRGPGITAGQTRSLQLPNEIDQPGICQFLDCVERNAWNSNQEDRSDSIRIAHGQTAKLRSRKVTS